MSFTRKFFEAVLSSFAIITTMWMFFFVAIIFSFAMFFMFDIIVNPIFPFGLVLIRVIFGKDGFLDTLIGVDD